MKNLELKVKVPSLDIVKQSLAFAEFIENLHQKDTYYLIGRKRLKLREQKGVGELIYYVRENKGNSKESKYFRFNILPGLLPFTKILLGFFFGQKRIVEKERYLYLYRHTRIHLDNVKNLGEFLELETVAYDNIPENLLLEEHEEVKRKLKLEPEQYISNSYSDLL